MDNQSEEGWYLEYSGADPVIKHMPHFIYLFYLLRLETMTY